RRRHQRVASRGQGADHHDQVKKGAVRDRRGAVVRTFLFRVRTGGWLGAGPEFKSVASEQGDCAMAKTVSDLLVERLLDWGVKVIFAHPGDGINGLFKAWRQNQDRLRYVQVRHEEAAAFAACGFAKFTGTLGVCMATSGPGGIHLLNGLYDAKCDGQPVLAITGHTFHDLSGTHYQQDV